MGIILFERPKLDVLLLDTLVMHPDAQSQGIGTLLIGAVEASRDPKVGEQSIWR